MALYSVYLPSSGQMTTQEIMGRAIFIKDRFSWGAFLIPPLPPLRFGFPPHSYYYYCYYYCYYYYLFLF